MSKTIVLASESRVVSDEVYAEIMRLIDQQPAIIPEGVPWAPPQEPVSAARDLFLEEEDSPDLLGTCLHDIEASLEFEPLVLSIEGLGTFKIEAEVSDFWVDLVGGSLEEVEVTSEVYFHVAERVEMVEVHPIYQEQIDSADVYLDENIIDYLTSENESMLGKDVVEEFRVWANFAEKGVETAYVAILAENFRRMREFLAKHGMELTHADLHELNEYLTA